MPGREDDLLLIFHGRRLRRVLPGLAVTYQLTAQRPLPRLSERLVRSSSWFCPSMVDRGKMRKSMGDDEGSPSR